MDGRSYAFKNERMSKIYHQIYLNPKGSDVNFVFNADTEHVEKVSAHKIILSLGSKVFDTMFFGSMTEPGDVRIVDASVAAFKEFLQFFYLPEVQLKSENIDQVLNLCKKYEMLDCLEVCETAFHKLLTMDDMCWGYSVSLFHEQQKIIQFCEQNIIANPNQIIGSKSFLECDRNLLKKILSLVSLNWSSLNMIIACMKWSKAECIRKNVMVEAKNQKQQLSNDLFDHIPFKNLTTEQFMQFIASFPGFFVAEEIEDITQSILVNNVGGNPFIETPNNCNRNPGQRHSSEFSIQSSSGNVTKDLKFVQQEKHVPPVFEPRRCFRKRNFD